MGRAPGSECAVAGVRDLPGAVTEGNVNKNSAGRKTLSRRRDSGVIDALLNSLLASAGRSQMAMSMRENS